MDKQADCHPTNLETPSKLHRRRFFSNIAKWFYSDAVYDEQPKLDAADIVVLLQTLGFKLQRYDKVANGPPTNDLKVEIRCGVSDLQAVLTLPNIACKCPNSVDTNAGQFWEVTGSAPTSKGNSLMHVNEAGSSLLPVVSMGTHGVVRDVMHCVFALIQNPPDINQNTDDGLIWASGYQFGPSLTSSTITTNSYTPRRHSLEAITGVVSLSAELRAVETQPQFKHMAASCAVPGGGDATPVSTSTSPYRLLREKTWEVEPKNTSPRPTSSPLPVLCSAFGQISLRVTREHTALAVPLIEAKRNIDRALKILQTPTHKSPVAKKYSPVQRPPSAKKSDLSRKLEAMKKSSGVTKKEAVPAGSRATVQRKRGTPVPGAVLAKVTPMRGTASAGSQQHQQQQQPPKSIPRPVITARRRFFTDASSPGSSTASGSTGNLSSIESTRRYFFSDLQKPIGTKIPSPSFARRTYN